MEKLTLNVLVVSLGDPYLDQGRLSRFDKTIICEKGKTEVITILPGYEILIFYEKDSTPIKKYLEKNNYIKNIFITRSSYLYPIPNMDISEITRKNYRFDDVIYLNYSTSFVAANHNYNFSNKKYLEIGMELKNLIKIIPDEISEEKNYVDLKFMKKGFFIIRIYCNDIKLYYYNKLDNHYPLKGKYTYTYNNIQEALPEINKIIGEMGYV